MNFQTKTLTKIITAGILFVCSAHYALASVTIAGTRIIFPGGQREQTVRTTNKGKLPALVQVWIDDGSKNADINSMKLPFTATPPVYRVEPGKGQSIRLIYNGMTLPQDRESVYWFNLLEIPPLDKKAQESDRLELAFRTRIKLFYRPTTLKSTSTDELDKLQWEVLSNGKGIKVTNPTPYYFSFDSAFVNVGNNKYPLSVDMVSPLGNKEFTFAKNSAPGAISGMEFRLINDYGSSIERKMTYSVGKGFSMKKTN